MDGRRQLIPDERTAALELLGIDHTDGPAPRWQPVDVDTYATDAPAPFDGWAFLLDAIEERRPAWQADAACRGIDPAAFFPERGQSTEPAKALCATCPTFDACAAYAVDIGARHGIWAGEGGRRKRTAEAA